MKTLLIFIIASIIGYSTFTVLVALLASLLFITATVRRDWQKVMMTRVWQHMAWDRALSVCSYGMLVSLPLIMFI